MTPTLLQVLNPHAIDPSKTAEFPDVPRNHWAYQYISQLAGNGILVGYPDGTFKGDAKMTRYEFATMLYRALQNGAPIDENMKRAMNEFGPELQNIRLNHFRIDRISGGDNDRHKTERVRVNNEPEINVTYTVPVFINNTTTSLRACESSKTGCIFVIHPVFCAK